ncbi:hypothetical protein A3863_06395 (plasmid) [Priestia endophytica]|uniref:hypothetical protein n=1 Tax=Priestia endophytica TaxID=135735 RepID=UPI000DCA8A79|nr:hypothetical protein [Priestia endophytica]RAS91300.1 hypothetical protein A3863_06395 [Priestia endophytica]
MYEYDRKDYYINKHDKHDKFKKVKCYCEEKEDRRKDEDKYDYKHDNKKDHDDKRKFILKGYLYFKEDDHDCECKKRY